jgi:hypothetical protein
MSTTVAEPTVRASVSASTVTDAAPTKQIVTRPLRQKKITVAQVRAALEDIARQHPRRVDQPAGEELPARYVAVNRPACLVANVLVRVGFNLGQLKALDAEHAVGDLFAAGVRVAESRHPALRKLDDNAKALLQWVQDKQDAGQQWGRIVTEALRPRASWLARWDRRKRPWLYA